MDLRDVRMMAVETTKVVKFLVIIIIIVGGGGGDDDNDDDQWWCSFIQDLPKNPKTPVESYDFLWL